MKTIQHTTIQTTLLALGLTFFTACGGGGGGSTPTGTQTPTVSDTEAPTISSTSPSYLELDVALDTNVSITFSESMLASSIDASTVLLKKAEGTAVEGNVSFDGNQTATFSPTSKLALLSECVVTVGTTASDLAGNTLSSEGNYSFTTREGEWGTPKLLEISNAECT